MFYGIINFGKEYWVVIEGYVDEIFWFVYYIIDDGFFYVVCNGGFDYLIVFFKWVNIYMKKGIVCGLFGWLVIYICCGKDVNFMLKLENIFIDVGVKNKEEVLKMGIMVGCVIIYDDEMEIFNNQYYVGWVLDNCMGGFCIVEVVCLIYENKVDLLFFLYIVNLVQEEVGLCGVEMIVEIIKLYVVIVIDVIYDIYMLLIDKKIYGDVKVGRGLLLIYVFVVYNNLFNFIIDVVEENKIEIQCEVVLCCMGIDMDVFVYSNGGVFLVLIFLLLCYMYIIVEMVYKQDVEGVIQLIYYSLLKIKVGQSFKYF